MAKLFGTMLTPKFRWTTEKVVVHRKILVRTSLSLVVLLLCMSTAHARTVDENVNLLHDTLNRSYDKAIIPMESPDKPVEVHYSSMIMNADIETANAELLKASYWAIAVWTDYRLTWDPNDYDGLNFTHFPASEVWVPDIASYNEASEAQYSTHIDDFREWYVGVSPTGHCHLIIPISGLFTCNGADFTNWPKDEQICVQFYASWSFSTKYIDIRMLDNPSANETQIQLPPDVLNSVNSRWTLSDLITIERYLVQFGGYIMPVEEYAMIQYNMHLYRNWDSVYSATLLTPTLVVILLTLVNFYYAESDPFAGKLVSLFNLGMSLAICFLNEGEVSLSGSEPKIFKLLMANQVLQVVHLLLVYIFSIVRRTSMQVSAGITSVLAHDRVQSILLLSVPFPKPASSVSMNSGSSANEGSARSEMTGVSVERSMGLDPGSGSLEPQPRAVRQLDDDVDAEDRRRFATALLAQALHRAAFVAFAVIFAVMTPTLWPTAPTVISHITDVK